MILFPLLRGLSLTVEIFFQFTEHTQGPKTSLCDGSWAHARLFIPSNCLMKRESQQIARMLSAAHWQLLLLIISLSPANCVNSYTMISAAGKLFIQSCLPHNPCYGGVVRGSAARPTGDRHRRRNEQVYLFTPRIRWEHHCFKYVHSRLWYNQR